MNSSRLLNLYVKYLSDFKAFVYKVSQIIKAVDYKDS